MMALRKGTDTTNFLFRYDFLSEARAFGDGLVGWYIVRVEDANDAPAVARRIDEEFANSPQETKRKPRSVCAGLGAADWRCDHDPGRHSDRRLFHHPARRRQYHGAIGAGTNRGTWACSKPSASVMPRRFGWFWANPVCWPAWGASSAWSIAWFLIGAGDPTGGRAAHVFLPAWTDLVGPAAGPGVGCGGGFAAGAAGDALRIAEALRRV
jgi:hypothetical protein